MNDSMLADVLVRTSEQRVLGLFAMNPDSPFYGREISKRLGISLGAVHAALRALEGRGILGAQFVGRTKLYRAKAAGPALRAYRVMNSLLVLEPLIDSLRAVSRRVVLYGSYATGTFTESSDLDLLIVAEDKERALKIVGSFARKTALDIRPLIKGQIEWMKVGSENPELFDELGHGLVLWERPVEESGL